MKTTPALIIFCFYISGAFTQNFEWVNVLGSAYVDEVDKIVADSLGNTYMIGDFDYAFDADSGPEVTTLTPVGENDIYIIKLSPDKSLIWAKQIGGPDYELPHDLLIDSLGNIYMVGTFRGTPDFDPGLGVFNMTADDEFYSEFILKMDLDGNLIWAVSAAGEETIIPDVIVIAPNHDLYIGGHIDGNSDIDPGPGVFMLNTEDGDIFIERLDIDGNFIWAQQFGQTNISLRSLDVDDDDNMYFTGSFSGTMDFDPGPLAYEYTAAGGGDVYISKWDPDGDFLWYQTIGGTESDAAIDLVLGKDNNIYLSGYYNGSCDFDPGLGTAFLTAVDWSDMFMSKYDSEGNYLWAYSLGDDGIDIHIDFILDSDDNIYMVGNYRYTVDFDPGPGVVTHGVGDTSPFYVKWDKDANFIYAYLISSGDYANAKDVFMDVNENVYVAGVFGGHTDFMPGPEELYYTAGVYPDYNYNTFLLKFNQDICQSFVIVPDSISNNFCGSDGFASVYGLNGAAPYLYEWNTVPPITDSIVSFIENGAYTVTVSDTNACVKTSTFIIDGPATVETDLEVNVVIEQIRPGFDADIWLDGFNNGCFPTSGTLQIILDPLMSYNTASPTPDYISGDTLQWLFTDITYDMPHFVPRIYITASEDITLGSHVCIEAKIIAAGEDINLTNNLIYFCPEVVGAYDPNDKTVYPQGACTDGFILNVQQLTYTIRFQNTGTADAINIYVTDTLSESLNINSIDIVNASHNMYTELIDGHIIKFVFPEIHLPDSTDNEPESHGFIIFQIKPDTALPEGTQIVNNAAIYFDYNDPVITNSVINTIINEVPVYEYTQNITLCEGDSIAVGNHVYYSAGSYKDMFTDANGCDSALTTIVETMHINTEIILSENELSCGQSFASYQWVDCDAGYSYLPGEIFQEFTPAVSGNYAVIVNVGYCTDTSECINFEYLNTIENTLDDLVEILPNPGHDWVTVNLKRNTVFKSCTITTLSGQVLDIIYADNNNVIKIDIRDLEASFYLIKILTESELVTIPFVKE